MKSNLQRSLFPANDADAEPAETHPDPDAANPNAVQATAEQNGRGPFETYQICATPAPPVDSEWASFLRTQGRVPQISDEKKPWEYRGWLMYYRLLLEDHLDIPKRWDYWYRTMTAGHLLNEPIPQIQFLGTRERSEGHKLIDQWVRLVDRLGEGWSSPLNVLLDWLLWGFGLASDPPKVTPQLNEELYRAVNIGPLLVKPYDYLGQWIAFQKGRWNPNAFYPTPHEVVEIMTAINFSGMQEKVKRLETVADPCMGTGRMLLHASNHSLRLYGMDIDGQVISAAKVNGALYCPWLVRPFPESFFAGENVEPSSSASGTGVGASSL